MKKNYILYVVLLLGGFLRFYGLNWGAPGYFFHPDELALYYATQRISLENLNPQFFAYGSLPIYLLKLTQQVTRYFPFIRSEYDAFFLGGRILSALLGCATLLILYKLGRSFYSQKVGLFAAAFLAVTVLHIQLSHFLTVDVMLVFFITLTLYYGAHLIEPPHKIRYYMLAGLFAGLALATKFSALSLLSVILVAHVLAFSDKRFLNFKSWGRIILAFLVAGVTIFLVQPYALLAYPEFYRQIKEQSDLVRGIIQYPYTIQYERTFPYFYHLRNLIGYSMGIPLGILVLAGTVYMAFVTFRRWAQSLNETLSSEVFVVSLRDLETREQDPSSGIARNFQVYQKITTLILVWTVVYFLLTAGLPVKFLRYMLPIFPFLCLLAAVALIEWESRAGKKSDVSSISSGQALKSWKGRLVLLLGVGVFLFSALYAGTFVTIYGKENTRMTASKWIYANIPPGSYLFTEGPWDLTLPLSLDRLSPEIYKSIPLDMYASDDARKLADFSQKLSQANLIIIASQRMYGSILRVPERYPLTAKYYKLLFDGKLGFNLAEVITRYPTPSLRGFSGRLTFKDPLADESFSVYDHPKILLFRKAKSLSASEIEALLTNTPPVYDSSNLLNKMLTVETSQVTPWLPLTEGDFEEDIEDVESIPSPEGEPTPIIPPEKRSLEKQNTATTGLITKSIPEKISADFKPMPIEGRWSEIKAAFIWLLTIELLGLLFLPITILIFQRLPDGGYPLSKVLGILIPAYLIWLLVSSGLTRYSRTLILSIIGVCLLISVCLALSTRHFLKAFFSRHGFQFLFNEIIFLLAFAGFLLFRAYNPDIFWSESSMDFSFINGILRSEKFPPFDPWASGFTLNYYYFGHYLVATLTKLILIPSQITYNLAFALIPALVISEIFSLLFNLTQRIRYGLLGVLLTCLIGNLDGLIQLYDVYWGKEGAFRFFRSAHEVIPYTVHEFPFWSFIFVDLHAHILNMPFFLLILFIGLNLLFEKGRTHEWVYQALPETFLNVLSWIIYAIGLGALATISSWDYPTSIIFLLLVAFYVGYARFKGAFYKTFKTYRFLLKPILLVLGVLVPLSIVLYLPFYQYFNRQQMGLGLVGRAATPFPSFLVFFGLFLFIIFSYFTKTSALLSKEHSKLRRSFCILISLLLFCILAIFPAYGLLLMVQWSFTNLLDLVHTDFVSSLLPNGMNGLWHVANLPYLVTLCLLLFLVLILITFPRQIQSSADGFIFLCLFLGLVIPLGCEWVFIRDFLQGGQVIQTITLFHFKFTIPEFTGEWKRMNTVFKFYMQAWFLLSIASTYLLYRLYNRAFLASTPSEHHLPSDWPLGTPGSSQPIASTSSISKIFIRSLRWVWTLILLILIGSSLVFTIMGIYGRKYHDTYPRVHLPPTLDGLAYIKAKDPAEYRAIAWLNENIPGNPVILEATGDDYLYQFNRISSNTGLPTVLGWGSHVEQRDHWGVAGERRQIIQAIYNIPRIENVMRWLLQYDVSYIYIGDTERNTYKKEGLEKFERAKDLLKEVYRDGPVQIYQVIR
jgi:YYY domain-containing protein